MGHEIKATTLEILEFINKQETPCLCDIATRFGYTLGSASVRLFRMEKHGLVEQVDYGKRRYCLSTKGEARLALLKEKVGTTGAARVELDAETEEMKKHMAAKDEEITSLKKDKLDLEAAVVALKRESYTLQMMMLMLSPGSNKLKLIPQQPV